jgi:two-component system, OmpR family, response regulator ChvI
MYSNDKQQKARILVVDDEYDAALTLKAILEEEEFEVDVFNDPTLALSNFKAGCYHLLLLDILMPKMNGFKLCQQLQNIDDKVKVCFITAYDVYYPALREMFPTWKLIVLLQNQLERVSW